MHKTHASRICPTHCNRHMHVRTDVRTYVDVAELSMNVALVNAREKRAIAQLEMGGTA